MSLSEDLLDHSGEILFSTHRELPANVEFRRSISASYYALFHRLTADASELLAPRVSSDVRHRIQRWFDHGEMKRICARFAKHAPEQPLRNLLGGNASDELRAVATSFLLLQDARHGADYDLGYKVDLDKARDLFITATTAIQAWKRISSSAEANIFILSFVLWKNWERDR